MKNPRHIFCVTPLLLAVAVAYNIRYAYILWVHGQSIWFNLHTVCAPAITALLVAVAVLHSHFHNRR